MAIITTQSYTDINEVYAQAIKQMDGVADYYLQAATLVLLVDDFDVELDLLKPFYQAYLTALTAYSGFSGSTVDAVKALQDHVMYYARDINSSRYTDINDWLEDKGIQVEVEFADISASAGYVIVDPNCVGACPT